jgi:hypothetical protein
MSKILSYRGLIKTGSQETILLSTKKGEKGYRIRKLQLMPNDPISTNVECVVKIYSDEQATGTSAIDFSDNRLLGAAYLENDNSGATPLNEQVVIFDNMTFNQDIYITCQAQASTSTMNYYLELEVVMLSEMEAMVATLKDIRNNS